MSIYAFWNGHTPFPFVIFGEHKIRQLVKYLGFVLVGLFSVETFFERILIVIFIQYNRINH
jgi:hypothetical protein